MYVIASFWAGQTSSQAMYCEMGRNLRQEASGVIEQKSDHSAVRVLRDEDGKKTAVYSVPTGSRLFWYADPDSNVEKLFRTVSVLLRRGNELIEHVPLDVGRPVAGSTQELPTLSPGHYELVLVGYPLAHGRGKLEFIAEWPFKVGAPGSAVESADDSYSLAG
jgi:hypothetical protein